MIALLLVCNLKSFTNIGVILVSNVLGVIPVGLGTTAEKIHFRRFVSPVCMLIHRLWVLWYPWLVSLNKIDVPHQDFVLFA